MYFIIGLGNPGKKYEYTRHNAGFLAINWLAEQAKINWKTNKKINSQTAEWKTKNKKIFLIKPLTFMNNSGLAVKAVLTYYKILPKTWFFFHQKKINLGNNLLVIHDDLDIALGKFKKTFAKNAGGHKGVQSIIDNLKTKEFWRLRIGIKPQNFSLAGQAKEKYVLSQFNKKELEILKAIFSSTEFKQTLNP